MGKQPSADERRKTQAESLVQTVKNLLDDQKKWIDQRMADVMGYSSGALEQLMFQQGQAMTVQAAIIEYLDDKSKLARDAVFAEERIKSIVTQNIAKAKAEREAREAGQKPAPVPRDPDEHGDGSGLNGHATPRQAGEVAYEGESEESRADRREQFIAMRTKHCPKCGAHPTYSCSNDDPGANVCPERRDPTASAYRSVDDPALYEARPADIAPESPAVAPAQSTGDA